MESGSELGAHGAGLAILGDPHRTKSDLRMVARAVREGWDVAPEKRPAIVDRMLEIVDKRECMVMTKQGPTMLDGPADSNAIMAANTLLGMTKHNLGDIHHQEKQGNDDQRLENETFAQAMAAYAALPDAEKVARAVAAGKVDLLPPRLKAMVK